MSILGDAFINRIIFFFWLFVSIWKHNWYFCSFWIWQLSWIDLLVLTNYFCEGLLGFLHLRWYHFWTEMILLSFIFLAYLLKLGLSVLGSVLILWSMDRSGKGGHPCPVFYLRESTFDFLLFSMGLAVDFLMKRLYAVDVIIFHS